LQDEAPQEDKSHMKTLFPKKPPPMACTIAERLFGIPEET
jgi:hypothetical protein